MICGIDARTFLTVNITCWQVGLCCSVHFPNAMTLTLTCIYRWPVSRSYFHPLHPTSRRITWLCLNLWVGCLERQSMRLESTWYYTALEVKLTSEQCSHCWYHFRVLWWRSHLPPSSLGQILGQPHTNTYSPMDELPSLDPELYKSPYLCQGNIPHHLCLDLVLILSWPCVGILTMQWIGFTSRPAHMYGWLDMITLHFDDTDNDMTFV